MNTLQNNTKFDLNISNYKKEELEEIFDLPSKYNLHLIESNATNLRDNIFEDNSINELTKENTINFIMTAKNILINQLKNLTDFKKISDADIYNINHKLKSSKIEENDFNHPLIEKKITPYGQSYPSEFYQGTINPLKKRILTKNLNIDTRFRDNYKNSLSTNFHFDLPIKFSNVLSIQLSSFEFPTSYYIISKKNGNNFFWLFANTPDNSTIESSPIIIPDGNYTPQDLIDFLNKYISELNNILINQIIFSLNINNSLSGSGQVFVKMSDTTPLIFNYSLNFQLDINGNPDSIPLSLKFGWLLGFREGLYENNITYVSEGICDTFGPSYMYLVIDDYNNNVNNNFYSAFNSSLLNKNILARISIQSPYFNVISQNTLSLITTPRQYFGPVDIQKMNIQLINEYGQIINLNSMDYSFCLTLQLSYDL